MAVMELNFLLIFFLVSVAIVGLIIWKTATSTLSKDRKIAVYITTIVAPIIGLILYFVFSSYNTEEKRAN